MTEHSVETTVTASGSVEDYPPARVSQVGDAIATSAGVDTSAVTVTVSSGSVVISASIVVASSGAADTLRTRLSAALATPKAAIAFFSSVAGGVPVLSIPVIRSVSRQVVVYPPPPETPPPTPPSTPPTPPPLPFAPPFPSSLDTGNSTSISSNALSASNDAGGSLVVYIIALVAVVALFAGWLWWRLKHPKPRDVDDIESQRKVVGRLSLKKAVSPSPASPRTSAPPSPRPVLIDYPPWPYAHPDEPRRVSIDDHLDVIETAVPGSPSLTSPKTPTKSPKSPKAALGSPQEVRSPRDLVLELQAAAFNDVAVSRRGSEESVETPGLRVDVETWAEWARSESGGASPAA